MNVGANFRRSPLNAAYSFFQLADIHHREQGGAVRARERVDAWRRLMAQPGSGIRELALKASAALEYVPASASCWDGHTFLDDDIDLIRKLLVEISRMDLRTADMRKSDIVPSTSICNAAYSFELASIAAYESLDAATEKADPALVAKAEAAFQRLLFTPSSNAADKGIKEKAITLFTGQRVDMGLGLLGWKTGSSFDAENNPPHLDAAIRFVRGEKVATHFQLHDVERDENGEPIIRLPDDVYVDDSVDD